MSSKDDYAYMVIETIKACTTVITNKSIKFRPVIRKIIKFSYFLICSTDLFVYVLPI